MLVLESRPVVQSGRGAFRSVAVAAAIAIVSAARGMAAVHQATSPEAEHINEKINLASSGDTVRVPAGSATWTQTVKIPKGKNITLQGAGIGQTRIASAVTAVNMDVTSSRLTGFDFTQSAAATAIVVRGQGFRVDHCRIKNVGAKGLGVYATGGTGIPHPKGLVDNCEFINTRNLVNGHMALLPDKASEPWFKPLNLGTDEAIYFEDNTFVLEQGYTGNIMDANYGGKYVFRYNTVLNGSLETHSVQGNHRAARKFEIYNNTFHGDRGSNIFWLIFLRGGTGVVFSNRVTGDFGAPYIALDAVRASKSCGGSGQGDGGSPWDGNRAIANGTGTHSGDTDAGMLRDPGQSWTPNGLVGFWVYNQSDGSKAMITANTATEIVAALTGGANNRWHHADAYKITRGYPLRDQIGQSTDESQWTESNPYPTQSTDPAYFWDNSINGSVLPAKVVNGSAFWIQEDRDYFHDTGPKPGYTPFPHPHPLRRTIQPPTGLGFVSPQN